MKYSDLNFENLRKIDKKKEFVLIPIGCLEVHGPNLPFASDTYLAEAFANLIEEKVSSIIMPAICYGHSAVTKDINGTISIDIENTASYIQNIICSLIKMKFEKIVIINIHKDNDLVIKLAINKIFEAYNVPVLYINPYINFSSLDKKVFCNLRNSYKESSMILASLKMLNKNKTIGTFKFPSTQYKKPIFLKKLLELGYIRYRYINEMQHIHPEKNASLDEGLQYMKLVTDKIVKNLLYFEEYINYLRKPDEL